YLALTLQGTGATATPTPAGSPAASATPTPTGPPGASATPTRTRTPTATGTAQSTPAGGSPTATPAPVPAVPGGTPALACEALLVLVLACGGAFHHSQRSRCGARPGVDWPAWASSTTTLSRG